MRIDRPREGDQPNRVLWCGEHIQREDAIDAQRRKYARGTPPEQWRTREYQRHGLPRDEYAPRFSADSARSVPDHREGERTRGRLDVRGRPEIELDLGSGDSEIMKRFKERNGGRLPAEQGYSQYNHRHVEAQAAAYLRMNGRREASLYVNQPPCARKPDGCVAMLPHMLPPGSRLTVFGPDGYLKIYRGKADERPGQ